MYCSKCGKYLPEGTNFCPGCGAPLRSYDPGYGAPQGVYSSAGPAAAPDDASSTGFGVLSFFLPVVGLILYLVWKDEYPLKARSAGKGAIIGAIVGVVLVVLMFIIVPLIIFGTVITQF